MRAKTKKSMTIHSNKNIQNVHDLHDFFQPQQAVPINAATNWLENTK